MGVIYHPVPALPHLVCFAALYIYLKFHFFNSWIKFHCIEVTWYHHPFISCWMMSRDGLWIEHLWTWMNTCLCSRKGEPFDWIPCVFQWGRMVDLFIGLWGTLDCFPVSAPIHTPSNAQCKSVLCLLHPHQHLLSLAFLILDILTTVIQNLTAICICILLMAKDGKDFLKQFFFPVFWYRISLCCPSCPWTL